MLASRTRSRRASGAFQAATGAHHPPASRCPAAACPRATVAPNPHETRRPGGVMARSHGDVASALQGRRAACPPHCRDRAPPAGGAQAWSLGARTRTKKCSRVGRAGRCDLLKSVLSCPPSFSASSLAEMDLVPHFHKTSVYTHAAIRALRRKPQFTFDGIHPTFRQVPPSAPRFSMQTCHRPMRKDYHMLRLWFPHRRLHRARNIVPIATFSTSSSLLQYVARTHRHAIPRHICSVMHSQS